MRVRMLGTGSADGLPNPFCRCATCDDARATGRTRAASSALIDDVILMDPGPGAGPAAGRQGVALADVAHVLITHGHPDHLAPEFLLWRSWIDGLTDLHLHGPAEALARCEHWLHPGAAITVHAVQPGDEFRLVVDDERTYDIRVIPSAHGHGNGDVYAEEAVLYDVTAADGQRLLYATDTGPLRASSLEAMHGRAFDLVLIEETFGDRAESAGHLNLRTLGMTLDDLRAIGAVTDRTDVVAFHLSHHNPPGRELDVALARIGARAVDDGTVIDTAAPRVAAYRELVIGGARSGKSRHAEQVAAMLGNVTYVATGGERPADAEWAERVAAHRARRPVGWRTIETTDLVTVLAHAGTGQTILIDCIALWLTAQLDAADAWSDDASAAARGTDAARAAIDRLVNAIADCPARLVMVTNEVGQGVVPATRSGRLFRDLLGIANARIAEACDNTTFMIAGRALATREPLLP